MNMEELIAMAQRIDTQNAELREHVAFLRKAVSAKRVKATSMQIIVKELTGETYPIDCYPDYSVDQLKHLVCKELGFPPEQQRLIFDGRQLENHRALDEYHLENESTVHLVLRLRGGMYTEQSGRSDMEPLPPPSLFGLQHRLEEAKKESNRWKCELAFLEHQLERLGQS